MHKWLIILVAALLAGCTCETDEGRQGNEVVDTMSQRKTMEAGKKAGAQLEKIDAERTKDLEEALGK